MKAQNTQMFTFEAEDVTGQLVKNIIVEAHVYRK